MPNPIDTSEITLSDELMELCEKLAQNTHDVWSKNRIKDGWSFGLFRDDIKKETPCLVPYSDLPEIEKEYDRNICLENLKVILKLGYKIE